MHAVRRLAALSAACTALFGASSAEAQEPPWKFGGGIFIGYAWGAAPGFMYGAEGFANRILNPEDAHTCVWEPKALSGIGPVLRIAGVPGSSVEATLAAQVGTELAPGFVSASGELGGTYRFGPQNAIGLHTGANVAAFLANFAWHGEWGLDHMSFLAGVRYPPLFGQPRGHCIEGRPFRDAHGASAKIPSARREAPAGSIARSERARRAGTAWERDAQHECASVPAFLQLAAELLALDAPPSLVHRALDAASDEIEHARLSADVAARYGGEVVRPVAPPSSFRPLVRGEAAIVRVAVESWIDGCIGEGGAAARARDAAARSQDPVAQVARRRISRDEARHAELGWSILEWAMGTGGNVVRDALADLRDVEIAPMDGESGLERYGCLDAPSIRRASDRAAAQCRYRLETMLQMSV